MPAGFTKRRWLAAKVMQTSATDCGPAALKCVFDSFGMQASYGKLLEACRTDGDGTSIDLLEDIAGGLGLDAEQTMLPHDHLPLDEASALPAIVVIRDQIRHQARLHRFQHFVVVWRRHGPIFQIMDPLRGRRWWTKERLLEHLYLHEVDVPIDDVREWVESEEFTEPLWRRMRDVGCGERRLLDAAQREGWRALLNLDAATRMVASQVRHGTLRRGSEATRALAAALKDPDAIPPAYFTARSTDPQPESLRLRGAVLLRVTGPSSGE